MRTPYQFVSCVAAILAASTVTSLVLPTDGSSLDKAPDGRPTTLPRNIATRDDAVSDNTTLHNDPFFYMASVDDDDDEIPDQTDLVPRWGPGSPPDKDDPAKVYCKDFEAITDETSEDSPLIDDCLSIIPNIQPPEHAADWRFMVGQTRVLVSYKTCVLAVSANDGVAKGQWIQVGNVDVIAVIQELASIRGKKTNNPSLVPGRGEKMGGKTSGKCMMRVLKKPSKTEFSIYHT
ncbi:hypothetical protein B0H65DRAFT_214348 [Neurospora tetraspora]|uniref:Ecp2 effector protein-like domain-containing protein n=1 Tax=Neurospora tetraspora TaxID=94610 RepID=A0AAE0MQC2_9PEZI|nr:hypothetical protein B0H65DRAFT_214348 [Neurospora tetraspora]